LGFSSGHEGVGGLEKNFLFTALTSLSLSSSVTVSALALLYHFLSLQNKNNFIQFTIKTANVGVRYCCRDPKYAVELMKLKILHPSGNKHISVHYMTETIMVILIKYRDVIAHIQLQIAKFAI